jgi:acyl dehydratase
MTPLASADELSPGQVFELGGFVLTREEVLDFARKFDPQPFHLDDAAARDSIFGQLVASGLHTYSAAVGHLIRSGVFARINLGGGGVELTWPAPLPPDVPVAMRVTVEDLRASRSKPDMAVVILRYRVATEAGDTVVLDAKATHFMRR